MQCLTRLSPFRLPKTILIPRSVAPICSRASWTNSPLSARNQSSLNSSGFAAALSWVLAFFTSEESQFRLSSGTRIDSVAPILTDSILALNSESRARVFTSTQVVVPLFEARRSGRLSFGLSAILCTWKRSASSRSRTDSIPESFIVCA